MRRRMDRRTAGHKATRVKPVPLDSHHPFIPSFPSLVLRSSIPRSLSQYCIAEDQVWFAVGFAVLRFLGSTIAVFFCFYESDGQGFALPFAIFPLS